ncbi:sterol carrier family protein [Saxibacter everestensis]|uniref:Sterol carrier family protein n=1 Tax=Saxibacter everestensis TaxID=2909229 RepID=A0ABY8QVN6_9MICO|nr:sterol carrier family protein [Brevibacteriaceae bacterium ZFBP1038]
MARRRIDEVAGRAALDAWCRHREPDADAGSVPDRRIIATAVRFTLEEIAERAPGNSVEVRVPPFGVTQCVEGPRHTRGTPPNVIETDAETWLSLVTGMLDWDQAKSEARLIASGLRADVGDWLPLFAAGTR